MRIFARLAHLIIFLSLFLVVSVKNVRSQDEVRRTHTQTESGLSDDSDDSRRDERKSEEDSEVRRADDAAREADPKTFYSEPREFHDTHYFQQRESNFQSRGSTGRTTPKNEIEAKAMEEAKLNPLSGTELTEKGVQMNDSRWHHSEGWVKMFQNRYGVHIHYNYNRKTGQTDDWKFKD